jgi:glycerophosphoryl diester phosphodiesterase
MGHKESELNDNLDEIMSDESELSLEDRIAALGTEIIANAFYLIKKAGKGIKTTEAEEDAQAEMIKRHKEITSTYALIQKANKKIASQSFDDKVLDRIKQRQSSIPSIVIANTNQREEK